ncbi:DUF4126 family protein [Mucilaginibacter xinganensis]|uniref:Putative membrane protein n=1 Tax=Mucilaginibacter xinganensis TaxID=1234841 RepID=A0A223NXG8_9SPHI|nr:DUF4126 family protein [Mucilaginibacter xinganensis]ASU34516.1 putative membrane protein [Mucilaginibacter xinganensis]
MRKIISKSNMKLTKPFWQVLGLGILAGMRTTSAPAIASHILSHHQSKTLKKSPLDFMQSGNVALGMKILAMGELVGDKLPQAPNRIAAGGVIGRCLAGSLAGASIYKAAGSNALTGALLGSVVALGSTFGSYYLRKYTVQKTHAFDPYVGAIEDVLVATAGAGLIITA